MRSWTEDLATRLTRALLRRRWPALVALMASAVVSLVLGARVQRDFAIEHHLPDRHPRRAAYERLRAELPPDDARVVVLVEPRGPDDVLAPAVLRRIDALGRAFEALPQVLSVDDPLTATDAWDDGALRVEPLLGRWKGDGPDPARLARAREAFARDPLVGPRVVTSDLRAAAVRVELLPAAAGSAAGREAFLVAAEAVLARHRGHDLALAMTGTPSVRAQFVRGMARDAARLLPLAAALAFALLVVALRSAFDALVALGATTLGIAWTLALLGLLGVPVTFLTTATPLLLLVVGVSDAIHLITEVRARAHEGADRVESIACAVGVVAPACLMTVVTVAAGLCSLLLLDVRLVTEFALVTAAGALLVFAATVVGVPLAYAFRAPRPLRGPGRVGAGVIGWVDAALVALTRPRARGVGAVAVVLLSLACLPLAQRVPRTCYLLDDLAEDSPIRRDRRRVEERLGGTFAIACVVRGAAPEAALQPAALEALVRLEAELRATPGVEGTTSILDPLRRLHRLLAPEEAAESPLPRTVEAAAQELLLVEGRTRRLLTPDHRTAVAWARVGDLGSPRVRALLERLEPRVAAIGREAGLEVELTGLPVVMQGVFEGLVGDLAASFGAACLWALLTFAVVFRSLRWGLVLVVPNALPMLGALATMGLLGLALKPSTVMVFSLAFAVAADDTVHLAARHRRLLARGLDPASAAARALREAGLPIVLTSCALALGFAVLTLSEFQAFVAMGLLLAVALGGAALTEVLLTPTLLARLAPAGAPPHAGDP